MSQAPEFIPPPEAEQAPEERSVLRAVVSSAESNPNLITHADVYPILAEKTTSHHQKVAALARVTFDTYRTTVLESADASILPNERELEGLVNFALFLEAKAAADSNIQIDLEMLDDAVEAIRTISPIPIAKSVERLEGQHPATQANTLIMKLWSFERYGNPDDMPTHFDKARAYCREHPYTKERTTSPGRSFLT